MLLNSLVFIFFPWATLASTASPVVYDEVFDVSYQGTSHDGIEEFLSVRYGQDTGGQNRFAPPKPYIPEASGVIDASMSGAACPQPRIPLKTDPYSIITNISEDCLTLRIARPSRIANKDQKLPVLVWIYGGGHTVGNIYDVSYNPTGLVKTAAAGGNPTIYVAINYRVNLFGNPVSQYLLDVNSTNLGLRDQRLALEWIQDHIAHFGGDPSQVTVFGEDTGAADIGLHALSARQNGRAFFRRAIAQSGSALSHWGANGETSRANFAAVAAGLGCIMANPNLWYTVNCMRQFTMQQLIDVAFEVAYKFEPLTGFHAFSPVIDGDLIASEPFRDFGPGDLHPEIESFLTGWNMDEASMQVPVQIEDTMAGAAWLSSRYPQIVLPVALQVIYLYLDGDFARRGICPEDVTTAWCATARALRDIEVTCPSIQQALLFAGADAGGPGSPDLYLYELNQSAFAPMLDRYGKGYLGVPHFSDVPYVFNELEETYNITDKAELRLAAQMSADWASFAAAGMPEDPRTWPMAMSPKKDAIQEVTMPLLAIRIIGGPSSGSRVMTFKERRRCEYVNDIFANVPGF